MIQIIIYQIYYKCPSDKMQEQSGYARQQQCGNQEFAHHNEDIQNGNKFVTALGLLLKKQQEASEEFMRAWNCIDQQINIKAQQDYCSQKGKAKQKPANKSQSSIFNLEKQSTEPINKVIKQQENKQMFEREKYHQQQAKQQKKQSVTFQQAFHIIGWKQQQAINQFQTAWKNIEVSQNRQITFNDDFKQSDQVCHVVPIQSKLSHKQQVFNQSKPIVAAKKQHKNYENDNHQLNHQNQKNIEQFKQMVAIINAKQHKNMQQSMIPNPQLKQSSIKLEKTRKSKGNSVSKIYSIQKQQTRKYSVKRSAQADNQMLANIQFLKSLRGLNQDSYKKQWKQPKYLNKNTLSQLKQSKRKHLHALGFIEGTTSMVSNKQGYIPSYDSPISNTLPDIRNSRKKGQIFKPAAFSIYAIQKTNEIFYNKMGQ